MKINYVIPMHRREEIKAELVKDIMIAYIGRTLSTGYSMKETVDIAVSCFDKHVPPESK